MGFLTTHVLDTAQGVPGSNMSVSLYRIIDKQRQLLSHQMTNSDGRCDGPLLTVVATHCAACHATAPAHAAFATAPAGVIFDSVKDIQRHKDGIYLQSVISNIMPLGNSTGMTQDERDLLGLWITQGAKLQ